MFHTLRSFFAQSFFISSPKLTEKTLPDQSGKVYIISGSNTGVGYHVASILYSHNAKVYMAARTESKARDAIKAIKEEHPKSAGSLEYLHLNLSDLSTIKASAEDFLSRETKLHWLDNNAGVMVPPKGSKGAQGLDLTYQTNLLGPFLFTKLLLPILKRTAESEPEGTVRVSWAGSMAVDLVAPKRLPWGTNENGEQILEDKNDTNLAYGVSKGGNFYFAKEFARRFGNKDGVLHNSYNPGNLASELQRHAENQYPAFMLWILRKTMLFPSVYGAYTELYAGLSPELTLKVSQGGYIVPWGRSTTVRPDLEAEAAKGEAGDAARLFEWAERVTKEYA